jgi:hypothetical protein
MLIRSKQKANINDVIVLNDNKKYRVINCRKLIPFLGEPTGYLLLIQEIKDND